MATTDLYQATGRLADEINRLVIMATQDGHDSVNVYCEGHLAFDAFLNLETPGEAHIAVQVMAVGTDGSYLSNGLEVYQESVEIGALHQALDRLTAYCESLG